MIRLATPADLSQAADIYEEILDREAQGPVYTNWQRGKYPTIDTARHPLDHPRRCGGGRGDPYPVHPSLLLRPRICPTDGGLL